MVPSTCEAYRSVTGGLRPTFQLAIWCHAKVTASGRAGDVILRRVSFVLCLESSVMFFRRFSVKALKLLPWPSGSDLFQHVSDR